MLTMEKFKMKNREEVHRSRFTGRESRDPYANFNMYLLYSIKGSWSQSHAAPAGHGTFENK